MDDVLLRGIGDLLHAGREKKVIATWSCAFTIVPTMIGDILSLFIRGSKFDAIG
jgi:ribosomal protein S19